MVELGRQDDFGASVQGASLGRVVIRQGHILATTCRNNTQGRNLLVLQQQTGDGGGAFDAQIEVVAQLSRTAIGHVVGVALDHNVDVGISGQHLRQLAYGACTLALNLEATRAEQQLVVHRHIHLAVATRDAEALAVETEQCLLHLLADVVERSVACSDGLFELGDACRTGIEVGLVAAQLFEHTRSLLRTLCQQRFIAGYESLFLDTEVGGVLDEVLDLHFERELIVGELFVLVGKGTIVVVHLLQLGISFVEGILQR